MVKKNKIVRIAKIGKKKRKEIIDKAKEMKIKIENIKEKKE